MDLKEQSELNLLTGVIYGEARGESLVGKLAVACVIRNRVKNPGWWGKDWKTVLIKPLQFSCLNIGDPNRELVEKACWAFQMCSDMPWRECRMAACGVLNDWFQDFTGGANHYYAFGSKEPVWAENRTVVFKEGNHLFYKI